MSINFYRIRTSILTTVLRFNSQFRNPMSCKLHNKSPGSVSAVSKDVNGSEEQSRELLPELSSCSPVRLDNVSRIIFLKVPTVSYHCDPQLRSVTPQRP